MNYGSIYYIKISHRSVMSVIPRIFYHFANSCNHRYCDVSMRTWETCRNRLAFTETVARIVCVSIASKTFLEAWERPKDNSRAGSWFSQSLLGLGRDNSIFVPSSFPYFLCPLRALAIFMQTDTRSWQCECRRSFGTEGEGGQRDR